MKLTRTNKKGFTIVELVIVIAVIAILAAVLIPNLSRLVDKANESSAMQAARNEYQAYLAEYAKDLTGKENFIIVKGDYAFEVTAGQFNEKAKDKSTVETEISGKDDLSKVYTLSTDTEKDDSKTYYTYDGETKKYTSTTEFTVGSVYEQSDLGSADVAIYAK